MLLHSLIKAITDASLLCNFYGRVQLGWRHHGAFPDTVKKKHCDVGHDETQSGQEFWVRGSQQIKLHIPLNVSFYSKELQGITLHKIMCNVLIVLGPLSPICAEDNNLLYQEKGQHVIFEGLCA